MDDVKGLKQAVISSHELINGRYDDGKHVVKFTKIKSQPKKDLARIPERPRCLLVLGDPMGPFQKYAGRTSISCGPVYDSPLKLSEPRP
jgi:hypothetical protein